MSDPPERPPQPPAAGGARPMVGGSAAIVRLLDRVDTFAATSAPVLLLGESGTGKELVARRLHEASDRRGGPFVAVNCAAFPDALIEAELFGHERGAFTGALSRRDGRFRAAHGGTLFLDEVAELPLPSQAKLLRVLADGTFEPLGSDRTVRVDVRIISATHRDLRARTSDGQFREDLYYRLKVLELRVPPLRKRPGDIPVLVEHFLRARLGPGAEPSLTPRAWAALMQYPFPGNVRELEHAIYHASVLAGGGAVDLEHLPVEISGLVDDDEDGADQPGAASGVPEPLGPLAELLRMREREILERALRATGGRKAKAAEILGISRKSLWERLRAHGLPGAEDAG